MHRHYYACSTHGSRTYQYVCYGPFKCYEQAEKYIKKSKYDRYLEKAKESQRKNKWTFEPIVPVDERVIYEDLDYRNNSDESQLLKKGKVKSAWSGIPQFMLEKKFIGNKSFIDFKKPTLVPILYPVWPSLFTEWQVNTEYELKKDIDRFYSRKKSTDIGTYTYAEEHITSINTSFVNDKSHLNKNLMITNSEDRLKRTEQKCDDYGMMVGIYLAELGVKDFNIKTYSSHDPNSHINFYNNCDVFINRTKNSTL